VKYTCIAALALAWAALSPASAHAHGSNCTYLNGPYCEFAHAVRHHGAQLPMVWERPRHTHPHTHRVRTPHWTTPRVHWYPAPRHVVPHGPVGGGACRIQSAFGCRLTVPYHGAGY